jgi:hypothetical protein
MSLQDDIDRSAAGPSSMDPVDIQAWLDAMRRQREGYKDFVLFIIVAVSVFVAFGLMAEGLDALAGHRLPWPHAHSAPSPHPERGF